MDIVASIGSFVLVLASVAPPDAESVLGAHGGDARPSMSASSSEARPSAEAVEAFRRGRAHFAAAEYAAALESFEYANTLFPAPDLAYDIAQCHMRLEQYDQAIPAFETYLATKENPADEADVRVLIEEARRRTDEQWTATRFVAASDTSPAHTRAPAVTVATPDPPTRADRPDARRHRPMIAAGATVLGLGAAATAGSVTALALAVDERNSELDAIAAGNPDGRTWAEAQALEREAKRLETAQYAALGVGIGVSVIGLVVMSVGLTRRADARRHAHSVAIVGTPGAHGAALKVRF